MSKPTPTQFEIDMARVGRKIGDPIPPQVKSRPDPGEYGGIYDDKPAAPPAPAPAPEPAPVQAAPAAPRAEHKTSEPKASGDQGSYRTRASRPESTRAGAKKEDDEE